MRIIQLTPGTGNFHCGSCLRDHALTKVLQTMGHDVLMVPLYLPYVLEEQAPTDRLYMGGVNLYLQQKSRLFRKTPRWFDRLLDSPRLLRWAADRSGMTSARQLGRMTLSMLRGEDGCQQKELNALTQSLAADEPPDVVCLSNVLLAGMAKQIKAQLSVPVVCTLQGEDAFLDTLPQPYRDQAWRQLTDRAADIDAFIAISNYYGELMTRRLSLPPQRVHVVYNGIDLDAFAPAPQPADPPTIGYLARLCHGKGLATLIDAFVIIKQRDRVKGVRLHVAGAMTPADKPFVRAQQRKLRQADVEPSVTITPNIERTAKVQMLQQLSVLSVPATYGEAFGLYVLEALASGVPVVQPRHAVFPELLAQTGGGILCEPDDPADLAGKLEALLLDPDRRQTLARQGRDNVIERFSAQRMAGQVAEVYDALRV